MGRRGPQPGDYRGKVKVMVPVHKPGRKVYFVPRMVRAENAGDFQPYTEKPKELKLLKPEDPNRLHSHFGSVKHHPVSNLHADIMTDIEHRNEIDTYSQNYLGTKKEPWNEKLNVSVRDVIVRIKGMRLESEKYSHPDIGDLYVFEYGMNSYAMSPKLEILQMFKTTDLAPARKFVEKYFSEKLNAMEKSLILKDINSILEKPTIANESVNAFASYTSGNNNVRMEFDGTTYSIIVNGSPISQSGDFGSAMSEYYRQIGEMVRMQESDPDMALNIFGDQVIQTNRSAIEKLSMMGKSMEADMLKNFDYSDLSFDDQIVFIKQIQNIPFNQRVYLKPGEHSPEGSQEYQGQRGGRFYAAGTGQKIGNGSSLPKLSHSKYLREYLDSVNKVNSIGDIKNLVYARNFLNKDEEDILESKIKDKFGITSTKYFNMKAKESIKNIPKENEKLSGEAKDFEGFDTPYVGDNKTNWDELGIEPPKINAKLIQDIAQNGFNPKKYPMKTYKKIVESSDGNKYNVSVNSSSGHSVLDYISSEDHLEGEVSEVDKREIGNINNSLQFLQDYIDFAHGAMSPDRKKMVLDSFEKRLNKAVEYATSKKEMPKTVKDIDEGGDLLVYQLGQLSKKINKAKMDDDPDLGISIAIEDVANYMHRNSDLMGYIYGSGVNSWENGIAKRVFDNLYEDTLPVKKSLRKTILQCNINDMLKKYSNIDIQKFEPPSNAIGMVPVMEEQGQAENEIGVKPRKLEYRNRQRIGENTVLLKASEIDVEEAKNIGQEIGIDFDKYDLDQFVRGINVEMEHGSKDPQTDIIGDDKYAAGKIAWAHLKEGIPDYYTKLEMVEKELKDLGMRPAPEEALQDRHREIERPIKVKDTYQLRHSPKEEAPIFGKDFPKQVEGEQAHEYVGLEGKDKIGQKPKPIIGKSFSPMMANTRIGDKQEAIEGVDGIGNFSTEEQTTAELDNQMQELSNYGDVVHNKKPFFDMIKSNSIYDQIEDIFSKSSSLIEGQQPLGVRTLGNEVERNIYYGLRDIVNNWYSKVDKSTSLDKATLDLKADLLKWQIESNKNVAADVRDIFNKGIEAGIRNTNVPVPDRLLGTFNYQIYKPTGISPAMENFQEEIFSNISKILNKHYVQKSGFPLYRTKRDIDSYLRKARYKTRLMFKSEVASMANLGQLIAWEQDPDKYKYEYFWNSMQDDRIKRISKMRAGGNPYSISEISFLWKNQIQSIDGKLENDCFNQRCSISRGNMLDKEWQDNRFYGQEHLYKSTMI